MNNIILPERIKERLKKIITLTESGNVGEAMAAQSALDRTLQRYDLTLAEFLALHKDTATFFLSYSLKWERWLFAQVATSLGLQFGDGVESHQIWVDAQPDEWIDFQQRYDAYRESLLHGFDAYYRAFVERNRIYCGDPISGRELTSNEQGLTTCVARIMPYIEEAKIDLFIRNF